MSYTVAQIWDYFLEADEEFLELELSSLKEAADLKRSLSVHKSRVLKDETVREVLGDLKLKYDLYAIDGSSLEVAELATEHKDGVILRISLDSNVGKERKFAAKIIGVE